MSATAMHRSPAVDAYIEKAKPFAQSILTYVRELMHEAAPDAEEAIKWSHPFFLYRGIILANMAGFKEHCSLGLWGSGTNDELRNAGIISGGSMGSFGRLTSVDDLPPRKKLLSFVHDAVKKIDDGVRTSSLTRKPRVAKPPVEVPEALAQALRKHKAAAAQFESMSSSCRREYCEWINSAKREQTRAKRLAEAVALIAEGKGRHWKYDTRA